MQPFQIGVCTWSTKQREIGAALEVIRDQLGLRLAQLGVYNENSALPDFDAIAATVEASGVEISATCAGFAGESYASIERIAQTGGYGPADLFEQRLAHTRRMAELTARLGVTMMTTHIGFVPHETNSSDFAAMVDRLKRVCEVLAERDLVLTMETGQEPAEVLAEFIARVGFDNIRVNFDPANMLLYGAGDPVVAVGVLGERIAHVHAKDGVASAKPGLEWGREVAIGQGQVDFAGLVAALRRVGYTGPLVIEREAGSQPVDDVRGGIEYLRSIVG